MPSTHPTKKQIIADIRQVHSKNESGNTTRAYYRKNGKYNHHYEKHWSTFAEFLDDAGILNQKKAEPETQTIAGDVWSIALPSTRIHTLPEIIEKYKIDESVWECVKFTATAHEMGYTHGKKEFRVGKVLPLFNARAEFKKKKNLELVRQELKDLFEQALESSPEAPKIFRESYPLEGNLLEINVPDVHFAKLSWAGETGHENYDTKIAEAIYDRAIDGLLFRSKGYRYDEVLFVVGNDLLQADDTESRTTSGTVVTTDGRYHKSFRVARRAVIKAIEKCRGVAPVRVIVVPGNHDNLSSWHLGESLAIYFDRYDDVIVENEPTPRKYYQFGNVGLMFTHGHQGKRQDYPLLFATERPDIFGTTYFREIHTGHTHQTKTEEMHGVRVRVLPALCPPDDWHADHGFVGNLRNAEAYVWNRAEGLIAQFFYNDNIQSPVNTVSKIKIGVGTN